MNGFDVTKALRGQGLGILSISHHLEEAFALADRVSVLRDGMPRRRRSWRTTAFSRPGPRTSAGAAEARLARREG